MKLVKFAGIAVGVVIICAAGFLYYMGMFSALKVEEKEMGPFTFVYEPFTGDYKNTGPVFDKVGRSLESDGILTEQGLGIYYDDPRTTPADKLRSECGVVVGEKYIPRLQELKDKYKIKAIPKEVSLVTAFSVKNGLSYMLGPIKAYPALTEYAQKAGYQPVGTYEFYDMPAKMIYFVMTFSKS